MRRPDLLIKMRGDAERIFRAAVRSVDPHEAVKRHVNLHGEILIVGVEREDRELDLGDLASALLGGRPWLLKL
jgi:hypothetical protein